MPGVGALTLISATDTGPTTGKAMTAPATNTRFVQASVRVSCDCRASDGGKGIQGWTP
jgi:hypothetical protein